MAGLKRSLIALSIYALQAAYNVSGVVLLDIDTQNAGKEISPLLHGIMFEDINHSGDGGIYSQLLRNNGFQGPSYTLDFWGSVGGSQVALDYDSPLNSAFPVTTKLTWPAGTVGDVGVTNTGYDGIVVNGDHYTGSVFIKGEYHGNMFFRLLGKTSGTEYAYGLTWVDINSSEYTEVKFDFWSGQAPDADNIWAFTFRAELAPQGWLNIALPTLFPSTYKLRENGLKPGLADTLEALQPTFLRFPGGNNLMGTSAERRWKWNETIGPLKNRPGRWGDWSYPNTDGLGLVEYFDWCEDMNLVPILDIWSGHVLYNPAGTVFGEALEPYVDDALTQLEFVIGDVATPGGALRASIGRPDPFPLQYVEIGNEDNLGGGCESYPDRFTQYYNAIHATYPHLTIIASTANHTCLPDPIPEGVWLDFHDYNWPDPFVAEYTFYDDWDRAHPVFIGEYARWFVDYPDMQGAVSEAVYMLGWERNADLIKMAAYAPTLQQDGYKQWTPNLITFSPTQIVRSVSYYVLQMFAKNKGDVVLPVTSSVAPGPVYWSASRSGDGQFIIKIANYGPDTQNFYLRIPGKNYANLTTINGASDGKNTPADPDHITPVTRRIQDFSGVFPVELGPWGVAVVKTT